MPMIMTNNYLNISATEKNMRIYRFAGADKVLRDFLNGQNALLNPRKWDDPWENGLRNTVFNNGPGGKRKYTFRDRAYGQCWTLNEESDATWRTYCPQKDGVRLTSKINKIYKSLEYGFSMIHGYDLTTCGKHPFTNISCFIGKISYKNKMDIAEYFKKLDSREIGSDKHAETLLLKRMEFKHEQEVRLIHLDPENNGENDVFYYPCNHTEVIEELLFDPRMNDYLFDDYKKAFVKLGFKGKIEKSTLYEVPRFEAE